MQEQHDPFSHDFVQFFYPELKPLEPLLFELMLANCRAYLQIYFSPVLAYDCWDECSRFDLKWDARQLKRLDQPVVSKILVKILSAPRCPIGLSAAIAVN